MKTWRFVAVLMILALLAGCGAGKKTTASKDSSPRAYPAPSSSGTESKPSAPQVPQPGTNSGAAPAQRNQPPQDMTFQNYGTNPVINAASQPVSTFGIDVDTASYTLALDYIRRGTLPPPEAIRVEEFINAFPYGYTAPTDQAVAAYVEVAPSPFRPNLQLVQIGLKAREVERSERKPAVLTFVVDTSGSMAMENRMELVKRSLHLLVDQLRTSDRVGIVAYSTNARVLIGHTSDKAKIRTVIDSLAPDGSTNAAEGLRFGYEMAYKDFDPEATNRVVLTTDGVANQGETTAEAILANLKPYRSRDIALTAVGVGMGNYNDVLLEQLADKANGNYAYVNNQDEARRIFVDQLTGTLETVAKDVKVQVRFDPEQVRTYRLVGYENRTMRNEDFRNDAADAGEMGAGHSVTALYEVQMINPNRLPAAGIGSVTVRYKDAVSGRAMEMSTLFRPAGSASARLRWAAAVAEFAGALKGSPWAAETGLPSIAKVAGEAANQMDRTEPLRDFIDMVERARTLRR